MSFSGSLIEGLLFPDSKNTGTSFSCTSGNCTFPLHSSLAVCHTCSNVIYDVQHQCTSEWCNSTIPSSDSLIFGDNILTINAVGSQQFKSWNIMAVGDVLTPDVDTLVVNGPSLLQFAALYYTENLCSQGWLDGDARQENDCISAVGAYGQEGVQMLDNQTRSYPEGIVFSQPNIGASVCTIKWCVQDFNTSISNNKLIESAEVNPAMAGELWEKTGSLPDWVYIPQPCYIDGIAHSTDEITGGKDDDPKYIKVGINVSTASEYNLTVLRECVYQIDDGFRFAAENFMQSGIYAGVFGTITSVLSGNAFLVPDLPSEHFVNETDTQYYPFWLQPLFASGMASQQTIDKTVEGLSRTLTNWIRIHGNDSEAITGVMTTNQSCVSIVWPWLALPAAVTVATCIFLAFVMTKSKQLQLACAWKSSPFAVTLHDLDSTRKFDIREGLSTDSVYTRTRNISVVLADDGDGFVLKQRYHSEVA
jgi:hypothetical protein